MKSIPFVFAASLLLAGIPLCSSNADFKKNQIAKVGAVTCGFTKSWFPVSRNGKSYKKVSKPTPAQKAACKTLVVGSKISLRKLPELNQIASSSGTSSQTVSGTPPTISEIVSSGPVTTFWRPGVVSSIATGTPTATQCGEFFTGRSDGESGGYLACYLTQNSGLALSEVVRAGTTMCYLKNMPTAEILSSGGLSLERGSFPSGGITTLFSTPEGSTPRIVKIGLSAGGETGGASTGILKIFAANQIAASGDLYRYEMIFCEGSSSQPQEIEQTRITSRGEFVSSSSNTGGGGEGSRFSGTVRAFLRSESGAFVFDTDRERTASFVSANQHEGQTFFHKADITINASNEILNKEYSVSTGDTRKSYSISNFSGSGATSIRFLQGAIKQTFSQGDFNGATEYRDSVYVSAPSNEYVAALSSVDLQSDSFFTGTPSPTSISPSISCSTTADIEVSVNMQNSAVQQIQQRCESERFSGEVDFCNNSALRDAQNRFNSVCTNP